MFLYKFLISLYLVITMIYLIVPLIFSSMSDYIKNQNYIIHLYNMDNDMHDQLLLVLLIIIISYAFGYFFSKLVHLNHFSNFKTIAISKKIYQFFLFLITLLIFLILIKNYNILSVTYIRQLILNNQGSYLSFLDTLNFIFYLLFIWRYSFISIREKKIDKIDIFIVLIFIIEAIFIKQRFQIIILIAILFFVYSSYKNIKIKNMVYGLLLLFILFIFTIYLRESAYYSIFISDSLILFGTEFYYASMSLINSLAHPLLEINIINDAMIYSIPRIILPNKDILLSAAHYIAQLGGKENFNPYGGFMTSAQLYASLSYLGIFIFYFLFPIILKIFLGLLYTSKNFFFAIALYFLSSFIISSIRTPLYITFSSFIKVIIFTFIFYSILFMLKTITKD